MFGIVLSSCIAQSKGARQTYHPNGQVHWRYEDKQGLPHGESTTYYESGFVKSKGHYSRGQRHGVFVFYDEDGAFVKRVLFDSDEAVWSTNAIEEDPPTSVLAAFPETPGGESSWDLIKILDDGETRPRHELPSLDRATPYDRAGLSVGISGGGDGKSVRRTSLYGQHRVGSWGMLVDLSIASLSSADATLDGRRTLELTAAHHSEVSRGNLTLKTGVVLPIGHDDQEGYIAMAAGTVQRPADAVAAQPSTVAIRTGTSWTHRGDYLLFQGDGAFDLAIGGAGTPARPFARINAGVGIGNDRIVATVESVNTMRLDHVSQRLHALGLGVSARLASAAVNLSLLRTSSLGGAANIGVAYDF